MENTDNHIKHVRKLQLRHSMSSDYPKNYEITTVTKGGLHIFIRPIKPGDTLLLQRFWKVLSPKTTYYRFSSFSKKLTRDFLQWLTVIDCQRETALVAIEYTGKEKRFLGMARLTGRMGDKVAEIAVLVGDPWHGKGVGAKLLSHMILIALDKNIKVIWGLVSKENLIMLKLARSLGFSVIPDDHSSQVEIFLDLTIPGIREKLLAANSE